MTTEQPNEPQTHEEIDAAAAEAIRAMIGRVEPGQMLRMTEAEPGRFIYARIVPGHMQGQDKVIERVFVDETFNGPSNAIDQMVELGELLETSFCSHWKRP